MSTDEKLDIVLLKLEKIDNVIESFTVKFEQIDRRFEQIDKRFEQIDKHFEQIDKHLEQIDERLDILSTDMEDIKSRVTRLEILCENEIPKKIQFVAEGHSILFRKLDDLTEHVMKLEYDGVRLDLLKTRVGRLERCVVE